MSELDLRHRLAERFGDDRHINIMIDRDGGQVIIVVWTVGDFDARILGVGCGDSFEEAAGDMLNEIKDPR